MGISKHTRIKQSRPLRPEKPPRLAQKLGQRVKGLSRIAHDLRFDEDGRSGGLDELGFGGAAELVGDGRLDDGVGGTCVDVEVAEERGVGGD